MSNSKKYQNFSGPELIEFAYKEFQDIYKNKVKKTTINNIVNGEIISTKDTNIFVDEIIDDAEFTQFNDPKFNDRLKLITKTLYNYQISAIKKIRELELNGYYINQKTKEKIRSNGWLLRLPIGSGKSLVFTYLALIYNSIPLNPIIISTSGFHIPEAEMTQLKYYPYYYENVGYIEGKENAVVMLKDYIQRPITVIITHRHLLQQLSDYIKTDFKAGVLKLRKINYATHKNEIDLDCDVLITIGENDIIKHLVSLSYEQPFMRIIVDDYTNMSGVDEFRQILATSTLFVSGSGFERDKNKISPSYYTLKHIEVDKYSLVSNPEDTKKGILRDSIATFNLIGSTTDFSTYSFINEIEEYCMSRYNLMPQQLYPFIEKNGNKLQDYFGLAFIIKNFDRFNNAINNVEKDLKKGILKEERVKYYKQWYNIMKSEIIEEYYDFNQQSQQRELKRRKIENPLMKQLLQNSNNAVTTIQTLVQQKCSCCQTLMEFNYGWGFVSTCCGSFFCANCSDSMVSSNLCFFKNNSNIEIKRCTDENNYYCVICHKTNPTYFVNSCRHKRNNIHAYSIIEEYMDVNDILENKSTKFDYYFKMILEGFKPTKKCNKLIETELEEKYNEILSEANNEILSEANNNILNENININPETKLNENINSNLKTKLNEKINLFNKDNIQKLILPLYPKDRLSILAINQIEKTLNKLEIKPCEMNKIRPCLLIYGCPEYMISRVQNHFNLFSNNPKSSLYNIDIIFKNNMGSLIGLHRNILGILVWNKPDNLDEIQQLIGRILRLNSWNNPLYFYISCETFNITPSKIENEKNDMKISNDEEQEDNFDSSIESEDLIDIKN